AVRNVAQVAQRTRQVTFQNFGIQHLGLAIADGLDEVAIVVAAAVERRHDLAVLVERSARAVAGHHNVALGTFEDYADAGILVGLGVQSADFEDQRLVAIVVNDHLRVGSVAGVGIAQASAIAENRVAELVDSQSPAAQVHLVNALVPQVAVAIGK